MILDLTPYSTTKNLGAAYNEAMRLLPDDAHACFRDGDTMWLTPDYGMILAKYVEAYPDAVLTCWTNRIHHRSPQLDTRAPQSADIAEHIVYAKQLASQPISVDTLHGPVSGFLMVVPKKVWQMHNFTEVQVFEDRGPYNLLGVDNEFINGVRALGVPVLRMNNLYLWHTYRLLDNSKEHLL